VHYSATAAENISTGDLGAAGDEQGVRAAAELAGAAPIIETLPDGYQSLLGHWFAKGNELSTGEWQRIALARASFRNAPVLILDEPTSAMDPWAEADWLRRFREMSTGRTVMVITHRFTTAMIADLIYVMSDGQVIEQGTHEQLVASGGLYAGGWNAQMRSSTTPK
jgi:ATP-binding cassette subfamily B protein